MKKVFFPATVLFLFLTFLFTQTKAVKASGTENCVPVYGGGVQCPRAGQVLIEKKVRNPSTGIFVDNLGLSDPMYSPGQVVIYHIIVQNTGDDNISSVSVTDRIPQFVELVSGVGNYDSNTRLMTFQTGEIASGSTQTFEIKVRVVDAGQLPDGKTVCPINTVDAQSPSQSDHVESEFCIEKTKVVPVVPKAGPEDWLLSATGLLTSLSVGHIIRKKANQ